MANFTGGGADDTFVGTVDPDNASGNGGNDALFGLGGNDRLDGGADDDVLDGGDDQDVVGGGAGSDTVSGANGSDYLFSDVISQGYFRPYFGNSAIAPLLDTGTAVDTLNGGAAGDELSAGYGDNVDGGDGFDGLLISFMGAGAGVTADFRILTTGGSIVIGGGTLKGIESIIWVEGSQYDDTIYDGDGSGNFAPIYGRGGNDHIVAGYYTGQLFGGDGDDILDNSHAGYGFDQYGEAGNDHLIGGGGYERLDGGEGNDQIEGNYGYDNIFGGAGNDVIDGGSFDDNLFGDAGDDTIYGAGDIDRIEGGDGNDVIYGDFSLISSGGAISGGPRTETLIGGAGNDTIYGDEGDDSIDGGADDDLLYGGTGDDSVTGGTGADRIDGGDGNDTGYGGDGADLLLSGIGTDQLSGEGGNDVLYFGAAFGVGDLAAGGDGRDSLVLQGNVTAVLTATNLVGIESISIQSGVNIKFGDTANNFYDFDVTTADGNVAAGQQLIVNAQSLRAGEDFTFDGSAESNGTFLVYGGHGVDDLTGGDGVDVFFFEGQRWGAGDTVDGGDGRDSLVISGGSGLTSITFAANAFTNIESISLNNRYASDPSQKPSYQLVLNNGNVAAGGTLIVNGSSIPAGQVVGIDGRAELDGNLILIGGGGNDTLRAGGGSDVLIGGGGADSIAGSAGADTFRYDAASDSAPGRSDLIGDFQSGLDKIDLSRVDANTAAAGDQAFSWIGAAAFSGVAGQLRTYDSGAYRWIAGDTDGDSDADILIAFHPSAAPVGPADFML